MDYKKIIKSIELKFKDIDKKIEHIINLAEQNGSLMSKLDIIRELSLTNEEYNILNEYLDYVDLNEKQIQKLIELNGILNNQSKYLDIVNEHAILKNPKSVNKNTIQYMLNKKTKNNDKSNVIIKIDFTNKEKVTLEKILKK